MVAKSLKSSHPLRRLLTIALVGGLCGFAGWWFGASRVWTDGLSLRVGVAQQPVRQILWTAPQLIDLGHSPVGDRADQASISPDGNDLYCVRGDALAKFHICVSHLHSGTWSEPVAEDAVNSDANDIGPRVTADGKYLLFSSDRTGGFGGYDLWASARKPDGNWGAPFNLGAQINTAFDELSPNPTPDGRHLIFATNRKAASSAQSEVWRPHTHPNAISDDDLWIAELTEPASAPTTVYTLAIEASAGTQADDDAGVAPPVPAALRFGHAREIAGLNTAYVEGASCMSPAGDFLYFSSDRPGGYGRFDLYRARVSSDWTFSQPENLGPSINTAANETAPALAAAGYRLYFSSDRGGAADELRLFTTDSREVFAQHQPRVLPRLSVAAWVMLGSLALLIPLLMSLRGWTDNRFSILQRCLLLSVLIHIVISFSLSFVSVTQQVRSYVKHETGLDIGLNLPKELAIGLSIRNSDTSDAPRPAQAAALPQVSAPLEAPPLPAGPAPVALHPAPANPGRVAVALAVPMLQPLGLEAKVSPISPQPTLPLAPPIAATPAQPHAQLAQVEVALPVLPAPPVEEARHIAPDVPVIHVDVAKAQATVAPVKAADTAAAPILPAIGLPSAGSGAGESGGLQVRPDARGSARSVPGPAIRLSSTAARSAPDAEPALASNNPETSVPPALAPATRPGDSSDSPSRVAAPVGVTIASSARTDAGQTSLAGVPGVPTPSAEMAPRLAPGALASVQTSGSPDSLPAPQVALPASPKVGGATGEKARDDEPARLATEVIPPSVRSSSAADENGRRHAALDLAPPAVAAVRNASSAPAHAGDIDEHAGAIASGISAPTIGPVLPNASDLSVPPARPEAAISPLPEALGLLHFNTPAPLTQRTPELRKPLIEKLGGTSESEKAVDRGLAYLARQQEPDGRWTLVTDHGRPGNRARSPHDVANTGVALLAFLARNHTPDKPGPYRDVVARGLNFLLEAQDRNGDVRGPADLRGNNAASGNMCDHAIAVLALTEAATMTQDARYVDAALRGAQFIVGAQNEQTGGWHYQPGEWGNTNVFGWQIMALHGAEMLGFQTPEMTRRRAAYYVTLAAGGHRKWLASFQPGSAMTAQMTAEMFFARLLMGYRPEPADAREVTDFLVQDFPDADSPDLYYWYYASLSLMQLQDKSWAGWNAAMRDVLVHLQHRGGDDDGAWTNSNRRVEGSGYVFSTSIAMLTLEVYYRYGLIQPGSR